MVEKISYEIESEVEGSHWWFVVRRKLLISVLSSFHLPPGCVTLDIGCGTGANLKELLAAGLPPIGLDRAFYALTLARTKVKAPLMNADLCALPIRSGSIGLVIAMDILEHLVDDMEGIRSLHDVLKKDGVLFLTVPAFQFLWGAQDIVTGHKRRYTRDEILSRVKREGFEIVKASYFNFFLFCPILLARQLIRLLRLNIASENKINFSWINGLLTAIFSVEPHVLKHCSFPFGVSIFLVARKK